MVSILHKPSADFTPKAASLNTGSCHDLVEYLSKEQNGYEKCDGFFTNYMDYITSIEAELLVDGNVKGLHKNEDKYYMLTLNPSQQELECLIYDVTGRPGIQDLNFLTDEQRNVVFASLKDYTRACMDRYAWNFNRKGVESGEDLVYFAKIETERHYKGMDPEVLKGEAKSGDAKPGLQLHVHVCVSRKSKTGIMLYPFGRQCRKRDRRDSCVPGSFWQKGWSYQNAQSFQAMYGFAEQLDFSLKEGRNRHSFPGINPDDDMEMRYWLMQMERKARRLYKWSDVAGHSDLLEVPRKAFRMGRFMLAFIQNPTHALFNKALNAFLMGAVQQMRGI